MVEYEQEERQRTAVRLQRAERATGWPARRRQYLPSVTAAGLQHGPCGQLDFNERQVARQLNRSGKCRPGFGQHRRRKRVGR